MVYECESCGYQTKKKSHFLRHKNRKYACAKTINDNEGHDNTQSNVCYNSRPNVTISRPNVTISRPNVTTFKCEKCNEDFSNKSKLTRHLTKCNGVDSLTCHICLLRFNNRMQKYRHKRKNNCVPPDPSINNTTIINNNNINNTTNNTTNNTNCHNTTNNNNVQIVNVFGNEDLTYLSTDKSILQRLKAFGKSGIYGLSKIIGDVHFNKERPENNTIIKPEEYGNGVMILNEDKEWEFREFEDVRETLITTITKYLRAYTTVKNNLGVKLIEEKERNIIKNIAYEFMAIEGVVPEELFAELEMDGDNVEDDVMDHKIRKFDKSTMKNIHNKTNNEYKREKGNYIKI